MFFSHGGMPGGGMPRSNSGPVDKALYDILNVSPSSSDNEIKRAYHKLAKEHHPDKNPTAGDKFKEISFAYEVLSNPEKRAVYDRSGLDGLKEGRDGFSDDILSHLFGGGGGSPFGGGLFGGGLFGGGHGGRRRPRRGQDTLHPLRVSLEDLYKGKTSKLQLSKQILCGTCKGVGGKEGSTQPCAPCKGRGVKVTLRSLGPGMVQQMQSVCGDCKGQGSVIAEKDRCKACQGKKTTKEVKILEVVVERGMREGQRITFRGEGDQEPDIEPGDVVIILQQKEHDVFIREGDNLFVQKSIGLTEALCGFHFVLTHLDGRSILVKSAPGEVIEPGSVRGLEGEGMPKNRDRSLFGVLYIKFEVEFPPVHFLENPKKYKLEALLPKRPPAQDKPEDVEEVSLMPIEDYKRATQDGRREAYHDDSDDEDGGEPGGQRVQCAQS